MIPLELISGFVGLALGAYKQIKDRQAQTFELALKGRRMDLDDTQHAREASANKPGIQWTKRTLAVMLVLTWCSIHLGISIPELLGLHSQVVVGYTELVPKFLFFGEKEAVRWVTIEGSTVTPAFSNIVTMIICYYFGSGGTRRH